MKQASFDTFYQSVKHKMLFHWKLVKQHILLGAESDHVSDFGEIVWCVVTADAYRALGWHYFISQRFKNCSFACTVDAK